MRYGPFQLFAPLRLLGVAIRFLQTLLQCGKPRNEVLKLVLDPFQFLGWVRQLLLRFYPMEPHVVVFDECVDAC